MQSCFIHRQKQLRTLVADNLDFETLRSPGCASPFAPSMFSYAARPFYRIVRRYEFDSVSTRETSRLRTVACFRKEDAEWHRPRQVARTRRDSRVFRFRRGSDHQSPWRQPLKQPRIQAVK